jgi:hypothetical protein
MIHDLKKQIVRELKELHAQIDVQKRVIKRNVGNERATSGAESQLKQLHTRVGVLETNLKPQEPEGEPA